MPKHLKGSLEAKTHMANLRAMRNYKKMKGHEQAINYQYEHMGQWMERNMGVSIDQVVEQMENA